MPEPPTDFRDIQQKKFQTGTATLSNVTSSATVVDLLLANVLRNGAVIFNDADKSMYVKFGTGASLTSFTEKILPKGSLVLRFPVWRGVITGIWDASPTGDARITETQ